MYYLHDGKEQAGPFSFEDLEKIENKNHYYGLQSLTCKYFD